MLGDCQFGKLDIVIRKIISRFGRDTVDILDALKQLRTIGVHVIFEQEELQNANIYSDLMVSVIKKLIVW